MKFLILKNLILKMLQALKYLNFQISIVKIAFYQYTSVYFYKCPRQYKNKYFYILSHFSVLVIMVSVLYTFLKLIMYTLDS